MSVGFCGVLGLRACSCRVLGLGLAGVQCESVGFSGVLGIGIVELHL